MTPQDAQVLDHLKNHVGITQLEATEKYGILRLSARIFDLRKEGYEISRVDRTEKNRFGNTSVFAEYRLAKR